MPTDEDNPTFAALLRRYRRTAGLTQEELAERARLSVRGITDLERGARLSPRKETVQLLAEALQLAPADRIRFAAAARPHGPTSVRNGEAADATEFLPPAGSDSRHRVPTLSGGFLGTAPQPPDGTDTGRPGTVIAQRGDASRPNLPAALSRLIGREREQGEVRALLAHERLVTLNGAGGVGKTRLALAVAGELVERQPDGVWLVELAALTDPALVTWAVAQALGLREEPDRPLLSTLQDHLKHKELLLVLDNCEHLIAACAALVGALLRAAPRLRVLATSREGLEVGGEHCYRVPSLPIPDLAHLPPAERLAESAAVALFVARATARRRDFALDERTGSAVAAVCARLDGIPLAIELAAAWVGSLPVDRIAARLDQSMQLLTGGSRDALPRQQTLRATLDWSWDLLGESERALLRRLSVFVGGWTLEAAEATCTGAEVESEEVVNLLNGLVNKSLVQAQEGGEEARYRLLEPVRQYAAGLLETAEYAAWGERHLDWCLSLAEEAESRLVGPDQRRWLARLEAEHDNLRTALGRSLAGEGTAAKQLRLATALDLFWRMHGSLSEGRRWLEETLAHGGTRNAPAALRARALHQAGFLAGRLGDYTRARVLLEESLTISRMLGNKEDIAHPLANLGEVATLSGDYTQAGALLETSLALFRELGDKLGIATVLSNLGGVALFQGDYARAWTLQEESLAIRRELGSMFSIAFMLATMGRVAYLQSDYERARAVLGESLLLSRDINAGVPVSISLECLVWMTLADGQAQRAARLGGMAEAVRAAIGLPVQPEERADHDQAVQAMRGALGEEAFVAAWADGRALSLEAAIAEALAGFTTG